MSICSSPAQRRPFAQFLHDTFIVDQDGRVLIGYFEQLFRKWCDENGRRDLLRIKKQQFLKHIYTVSGFENVASFKPHGRPRVYTCIRVQ